MYRQKIGQTIAPLDFYADRDALERGFTDAEKIFLPGGFVVVVPSSYSQPITAIDPNYHWTFSRAFYVYAPRHEGASGGLTLLATIHHQPDDGIQAQRTALLISRLLGEYGQRFGRDVVFPNGASKADVWLATQMPSGGSDIGGQTRENQVYLFGSQVVARTPLEWVRTVAHEWGHLTLSAARGYREPENDSAGYLGERLYLKWLREDRASLPANAPDDGTTVADLDLYYRRQISPLEQRWQSGGPGSKLLDDDSTAAMDYYIGSVLATDSAFGSPIAAHALLSVLDVHARDFLVALRRDITDSTAFAAHPPVWVPLSKGKYTLLSSASIGSLKTSLHVPVAGWRHWDTLPGKNELDFQRVDREVVR